MKNEKVVIRRVRDSLARLFGRIGMRDVDARVFAELLVSDEELSADEISVRTDYSLSAVTTSLHRLMRFNIVVRVKRGKKYYYKAEGHILKALYSLLQEIYLHEVIPLKRLVEESVDRVEGKAKRKLRKLKERLDVAEEYLKLLLEAR